LNYTPTTLGVQVEEKLYMGVREQKRLNTTDPEDSHLRTHRRENLKSYLKQNSFMGYKNIDQELK
jgi:hypothetical protein